VRCECRSLDSTRVGRQERADDPQGGGLAGSVGPQQAEDLSRLGLERDAAQHLVGPKRLLQALDRDRRAAHPVRRVRFAGALGFALAVFGLAAAFALAGAAGFAAAGLTSRLLGVTRSCAGASTAGVSTGATPMVLDSVRWQVSQVTIVRTSAPS